MLQRCAEMRDEEVRIVKGVDGRLTGEAYVHISGARAKIRLALAKDRTLMPVSVLNVHRLPLSLVAAKTELACVSVHADIMVSTTDAALFHYAPCTSLFTAQEGPL